MKPELSRLLAFTKNVAISNGDYNIAFEIAKITKEEDITEDIKKYIKKIIESD